jgi:hypothetical protein
MWAQRFETSIPDDGRDYGAELRSIVAEIQRDGYSVVTPRRLTA